MASDLPNRSAGPAAGEARYHEEVQTDPRTPCQRDRDRVLYSGAFARLAEITQVVSPGRGYVVHNRLTHSLKVGQIARRISEGLLARYPEEIAALGGLDSEAAEAAGFAHDLGHPPFGHAAEEELHRSVVAAGVSDGYEGNAQSFRIVARLAASDALGATNGLETLICGLNLTRRTLDGLLKYPWLHGENGAKKNKWGCYRTEKAIFEWTRRGAASLRRSITAEVMDWADDITFAIHDLLDFYCAGRIPIDRCKVDGGRAKQRLIDGMFRRRNEWQPEKTEYLGALDRLLGWFPFDADHHYGNSWEERAKLHGFATILITQFVGALKPTPGGENAVEIDPTARREVEVLKQFTWEYVIEDPDLTAQQHGQRAAIRCVFQWLLENAKSRKHEALPLDFREQVRQAATEEEYVRCVADCVSSMTEKQIMRMHGSLRGIEAADG